jgi:hypothetical protein
MTAENNSIQPATCSALFTLSQWLNEICPVVFVEAANIHHFPEGAQGILSVERLTQGTLLWLQGRVGEGSYTRVDSEGRHCTIKVPVVVGRVANTGLGIEAVGGFPLS